MKLKALILTAVMIVGTYALIQLFLGYDKKEFADLHDSKSPTFSSLVFTKPSSMYDIPEMWYIDDEAEIESILDFLQEYHVRKLKPEKINKYDDIEQFSISLKDEAGNILTIIVSEELIIQNSSLYYEVVDGPLDMDWLVHFFVSNQI